RAAIKIVFQRDGYLLRHPGLLTPHRLSEPYKINCQDRSSPGDPPTSCPREMRPTPAPFDAHGPGATTNARFAAEADVLPTGRMVNIYSSTPTAVPVSSEAARVAAKGEGFSLAGVYLGSGRSLPVRFTERGGRCN